MIDYKRIAKNTLFLYIRTLLIVLISLYTCRIILKTLGVSDYGIYNIVGGIVSIFTFLNTAMANATQRFLTFELGKGNLHKLHQVFCTSITIHIIIAVIVLILSETVGIWFLNTHMNIPHERLYAANWVFQMSVLSAIVGILSVPYNASIIAHERMSIFAFVSLLEVILKLLAVYMLVIYDIDRLILYAVLILLIQLIVRIIYGLYCGRNFQECNFRFLYEKTLFSEMSKFSGWSLWGNFAFFAFFQGINILLNIFFGPTVNAARAITIQIQSAIQNFVAGFQTAINPQITKSYAIKDCHQMNLLLFASGRYSYYLVFILALPIFLEAPLMLSIWLDNVPEHSVNFVRLTLCIVLISSLSNPLEIAAQATGQIKMWQIITGSMLFMILPISYITLSIFHFPEVAFIVQLLIFVLALFARLVMLRQMIDFPIDQYFKRVLAQIGIVSLVSVIFPLTSFFLLPKTILGAIIVCLICFSSVFISIYLLGINKEERLFLRQKARAIKGGFLNYIIKERR